MLDFNRVLIFEFFAHFLARDLQKGCFQQHFAPPLREEFVTVHGGASASVQRKKFRVLLPFFFAASVRHFFNQARDLHLRPGNARKLLRVFVEVNAELHRDLFSLEPTASTRYKETVWVGFVVICHKVLPELSSKAIERAMELEGIEPLASTPSPRSPSSDLASGGVAFVLPARADFEDEVDDARGTGDGAGGEEDIRVSQPLDSGPAEAGVAPVSDATPSASLAVLDPLSDVTRTQGWRCGECHRANPADAMTCDFCTSLRPSLSCRPADGSEPPIGSSEPSPDHLADGSEPPVGSELPRPRRLTDGSKRPPPSPLKPPDPSCPIIGSEPHNRSMLPSPDRLAGGCFATQVGESVFAGGLEGDWVFADTVSAVL